MKVRGNTRLTFWCPGCNEAHVISVEPGRWTWNSDRQRPTFTPSVLVRSGHYAPQHTGDCWCTWAQRHGEPAPFSCSICHSFVTEGKIQFLSDSTHGLSGQTVDLPDLPESLIMHGDE